MPPSATFLTLYFLDDHSRVILRPIPGQPRSDYINANFVDVSSAVEIHSNFEL